MPKERSLFISHKHVDHKIANVLGEFAKERSLGRVKVHLSSDPNFEGPKIGKSLTDQLKQALRNTNTVVLLYTSADQDWSYCMWECGVALDPETEDTNILVLQCGNDVPGPFADQVRINARRRDDILRFVQMFLTEPDFFPGFDEPVATFQAIDPQITKAADELFSNLQAVLPPLEEEPTEEWPAWPFLKVELTLDQVDYLRNLDFSARKDWTTEELPKLGLVAESDGRVQELFGKAKFPINLPLNQILTYWVNGHPNLAKDWFDGLCNQLTVAALGEFPVIHWAHLTGPRGAKYIPILSRVTRIPSQRKMQFHIYFYNISDLRGVSAKSKMIPLSDIYSINLMKSPPEQLLLSALIKQLAQKGKNRIPLFDGQSRVKYIIHRSMIDMYIAQCALDSDFSEKVSTITLAQILKDQSMKAIFETTFGLVSQDCSLADVKAKMDEIPECRDVFVTHNGTKEEPVLGWVTNIILGQSS